jgi:release factor glutamine methyltransferase
VENRWNIKELLVWTTRYFSERGMDNPRLEAELLLAHTLGQDRVQLYADYDRPVNQEERQGFKELIQRRVRGEPVAYIVGYREFMSLRFQVNSRVLIPRPDTETMVEKILDLCRGRSLHICDVGTGSGAIAVSLAHYLPSSRVVATDISEEALSIARLNAAANQVEIDFHQGDLLAPLQDYPPLDLIVANLPYIPIDEYRALDPGVRDYEPVQALLAPGDGLDLYRRLLPQALDKLKSGGYLFAEIGYHQGMPAQEMASGFQQVEIIKDMAGRDSILKARKG